MVALLASVRELYECIKDYKQIKKTTPESGRLYVAEMGISAAAGFTFTSCVLFLLGLVAIINPARWLGANAIVLNDIIIGFFIALGLVLMVATLAMNVFRHLANTEIDKERV